MAQKLSLSQTLEKAVEIIEFISSRKQHAGITEIAADLGMNTTTVQRIVNTLRKHGYLEQNLENRKYGLGLKFLQIGNRLLEGLDLRKVARPFLEELRDKTGETVHLMILNEAMGVYVDTVESLQRSRVASAVGSREDLHSSAVGKALLAFLPEDKVDEIVRLRGLRRKTDRTITDARELEQHLAETRKRGYSIDDEEAEVGTRCIGAPIFNYRGELAASLSVAAPSYRLNRKRVEELSGVVLEITSKISQHLGGRC